MDVRRLSIKSWPFQIVIKSDNSDVDDWCVENVGKRFYDWYEYYTPDRGRIFAFREESSLLIFKLRWN